MVVSQLPFGSGLKVWKGDFPPYVEAELKKKNHKNPRSRKVAFDPTPRRAGIDRHLLAATRQGPESQPRPLADLIYTSSRK